MGAVRAHVMLLKRDAFGKGCDGDIVLQRGFAFVDKGDDARIKVVFDRKHGAMLSASCAKASAHRSLAFM